VVVADAGGAATSAGAAVGSGVAAVAAALAVVAGLELEGAMKLAVVGTDGEAEAGADAVESDDDTVGALMAVCESAGLQPRAKAAPVTTRSWPQLRTRRVRTLRMRAQ
jgi:hypothetical protein